MSKCVTCKGAGYTEDDDGDYVKRLGNGEECEECGRPFCFEKIKIWFSVVNESGNRTRTTETFDYQGDTPLEAINSLLDEYSGPRGERLAEIHRIDVNRTPPLKEEEMGQRSVVYEESGVLIHNITLGVRK